MTGREDGRWWQYKSRGSIVAIFHAGVMIADFLKVKVKGCGESEKHTHQTPGRTSARRSRGSGDQSPLHLSETSGIRRVVEVAGTRSSVRCDVWRPCPAHPTVLELIREYKDNCDSRGVVPTLGWQQDSGNESDWFPQLIR